MSTIPAEARFNLPTELPDAYAALARVDRVAAEHLDHTIYELVKLRASQINGCAYCLDMHARDARTAGESQLRLDVLAAWHEVPFFDERERAALAFCEAVTLISEDGVPDDVWEAAAAAFPGEELAGLLTACIAINSWNRMCVASRAIPTGGASG